MVAGSGLELTVTAMSRRRMEARFPSRGRVAFALVAATLLSGCGQGQLEERPARQLPEFGVAVFELPDRGTPTVRWSGFDGSTPQGVLASDLLPAVGGAQALPFPGSTGDPVLDVFVREAVQLSTGEAPSGKPAGLVEESTLPLKILRYPGIDPVIVAGIESSIPTLLRLVGGWEDMAPTLLFVTNEEPDAETWLRAAATEEGCVVPPQWYPFPATDMPGGVPVQNLCGEDRPGFILNMSQYTRNTPNSDLTAVTRTFVDDLFDQWQYQRRPEVRDNGVEPRWLLQGSQQLPFMLYLASRTGVVEFDQIPQACMSAGLRGHDFEAFIPNGNNSCPHSLGRLAMILLVARVGTGPVVEYFSSPANGQSFEERFEAMAGESYDGFTERLGRWMTLRDQAASDTGFTARRHAELVSMLG